MERRITSAVLLISVFLSASNFIRQPFWFQEFISACWLLFLGVHLLLLPALYRRAIRGFSMVWWGSFIFVVFAIYEYIQILYAFELQPRKIVSAEQSTTHSVFYINKYIRNEDTENTSKIIDTKDPDTVLILEADKAWIERSQIRNRYPNNYEVLDRGVWNLALYSRYPILDARSDIGDDIPPVLIAKLVLSENIEAPIAFVHFPPPISQDAWVKARYGARRISTELRHSPEPWIIIGDFNSGPFGRVYESILNAARVSNGAEGFGLYKTWHAKSKILRTTIDHILVKDTVSVTDFEVIDVPGSDHRGIFARYAIEAPKD